MNLNSTTVLTDTDHTQEIKPGDMSIDGSLIDKDSPPHFITHRKGATTDMQEFRAEFKTFQSSIVSILESWFARQDDKFSKLIDDFSEIKTSIKFINDKYEDLTAKTDVVAMRVTTLENGAAAIRHNSSRITDLEAKLDVMEQQTRQCNIEVSNLPEKRGENLTAILENIATLVKVPVGKQDLVSIHRVPQALAASHRPKNIIVKFSSRLFRDSFVSAVRRHKGIMSEQLSIPGSSHKIYINEHLTLKNKNLFRQSREAAKQHGFRFVWIKHGSVLVRRSETSPVFSVRSERDLSKINSEVK